MMLFALFVWVKWTLFLHFLHLPENVTRKPKKLQSVQSIFSSILVTLKQRLWKKKHDLSYFFTSFNQSKHLFEVNTWYLKLISHWLRTGSHSLYSKTSVQFVVCSVLSTVARFLCVSWIEISVITKWSTCLDSWQCGRVFHAGYHSLSLQS